MLFFDSWMTLLRVVLFGFIAYSFLVFLLRISGTRTVSQLNSFDLVITMIFGTLLASTLISTNVSLVSGLTALTTIVILQFIYASLAVRFNFFSKLIKATPTLLYYQGEFLESLMKKKRIQRVEILQSIRSQGIGSMEEVEAVVLETNANLSIIKKSSKGDLQALKNVTGFSELKKKNPAEED